MKHTNLSLSKIVQLALISSIAFTAISVLVLAIGADRFTALGDPYHHTGDFAPQRALLPWVGVVITIIITAVYHYVTKSDNTRYRR